MNIIPGLPASSIPQCKWNRDEDSYLELFQAIGCFEATSSGAHQLSETIFKVKLLKS